MGAGTRATRRSSWWAAVLYATVIAIGLAVPCEADKKEKEEEKAEAPRYSVLGRDPSAFADAEALLAESNQPLVGDEEARARLLDLRRSIEKDGLWSPRLWEALDSIRGVRMSPPVIAELSEIARSAVAPKRPPSGSTTTAAARDFRQGNAHYGEERFDSAVRSYRSALTRHPRLWDAWNNMALAELHSDNDLVAIFGFASLAANAPQYVGATINLAVCLERVGMSDRAYETARRTVEGNPDVAMARYNKAWFESSRGDYGSARGELERVRESVEEYAPAERLQAINELEAGHGIDADGMKALGAGDPDEPAPKIAVKRIRSPMATAYAGETAVAKVPRDTRILVSEEAGDWVAFYWPMRAGKRRLWLNTADLSESAAAAGDAASAAGPAEEVTAEQRASAGRFVGTWGEEWGDIRKKSSITITLTAGRPQVSMPGWKIWDARLEGERLVFRKKGGDSGWEFVYTVTPTSKGMDLEVFRIHDRKSFSGRLTK